MLDLADIADVIADAVKEATTPLLDRIDALERRELVLPEKGDPGEPGLPGEKGEPGEVDMEAVRSLIGEVIAALPPAKKGDPGEPGRDVDMDEVGTRIETAVKSAVDALPAPKDGEPGRDGAGLSDALRDAEGNLVLVMADGRTKNLGKIDGAPGKDGETFTIDDFDVVPIDERTIKLCFTKGDARHSFELAFPVLIGRGIWSIEEDYARGDVVTWGGTAWEAVEPEKGTKPDLSKGGWRILAKRGRDGKDAK
jgi:hypothetical protein